MKTKRRGQVSVEYLIVLGFATFAITGIIALAFYYVNSTGDQMKYNHIKNFADSLITNAESVYFAGPPSKIMISPYLPKGVNDIDFVEDPPGKYYLIINYSISSGQNVMGFKSNAPLSTTLNSVSINEGIKNLIVQFSGNVINVSEAR